VLPAPLLAAACCCTRPARRRMLLLLADSELRPRAPLVLAAAAATQEAAHPKAATVLHGGAHHGELGRSLPHLGLPLAGERGTPRRQEERAWRRAGWVRRRAS